MADGYYYRSKLWEAVRELNLDFIGKLRVDANLRYLYTGEQNRLVAPPKYDGKFDSNDLSRLKFVKNLNPGVSLYTLVLWSCCLNCQISLACISEVQANGKIKNALLFSTDIHLLLSKFLNIIRLVSRLNLFFVMPSNLRDCLIVKLVIYHGLIFILMPV